MLVQFFKVGEKEPVNAFSIGSHVVGRGPALQCNDKRISRNHATIDVTQEEVKITSTHINPCFIKIAGSNTITVLKNNSTTQLNDGDTFAFLPDDFWFNIKIIQSDTSDITESKVDLICSKSPKRVNSDEDGPAEKKVKTEDVEIRNNFEEGSFSVDGSELLCPNSNIAKGDDTMTVEFVDKNLEVQENKDTINIEVPENEKLGDNLLIDDSENCTTSTDAAKTEPSSSKEDDNVCDSSKGDEEASGSNSKPKRERCWYAATCYRKNAIHRQTFTHPGDSDFDSDPNDDRPTCSYGAKCYRKNKDHRQNYKHPFMQPNVKQKRSRKKVVRLNAASTQDMELFDSDSEDPFVVDDDSEEYEEDSDMDDSDFNESQEIEEDSQNIKQLVKEANKFVKK